MNARLMNAVMMVVFLTARCYARQVKTEQGSNQMDGSKWTTLTISAQNPYQLSNGAGAFTPSFTVRCDSRGKPGKERRTLEILLETGGIQPRTPPNGLAAALAPKENQMRLLREQVFFRIKLDEAKPERRRWSLLPSSDTTYRYWGDGESGLGYMLVPSKFLDRVFATKTLMIEFQPFGQENFFVSEFHPEGLKQEFERHEECGLK
ncbi:MAG: hypothetical protein WBL61_08165 [Bryobacteraceae bacterium]